MVTTPFSEDCILGNQINTANLEPPALNRLFNLNEELNDNEFEAGLTECFEFISTFKDLFLHTNVIQSFQQLPSSIELYKDIISDVSLISLEFSKSEFMNMAFLMTKLYFTLINMHPIDDISPHLQQIFDTLSCYDFSGNVMNHVVISFLIKNLLEDRVEYLESLPLKEHLSSYHKLKKLLGALENRFNLTKLSPYLKVVLLLFLNERLLTTRLFVEYIDDMTNHNTHIRSLKWNLQSELKKIEKQPSIFGMEAQNIASLKKLLRTLLSKLKFKAFMSYREMKSIFLGRDQYGQYYSIPLHANCILVEKSNYGDKLDDFVNFSVKTDREHELRDSVYFIDSKNVLLLLYKEISNQNNEERILYKNMNRFLKNFTPEIFIKNPSYTQMNQVFLKISPKTLNIPVRNEPLSKLEEFNVSVTPSIVVNQLTVQNHSGQENCGVVITPVEKIETLKPSNSLEWKKQDLLIILKQLNYLYVIFKEAYNDFVRNDIFEIFIGHCEEEKFRSVEFIKTLLLKLLDFINEKKLISFHKRSKKNLTEHRTNFILSLKKFIFSSKDADELQLALLSIQINSTLSGKILGDQCSICYLTYSTDKLLNCIYCTFNIHTFCNKDTIHLKMGSFQHWSCALCKSQISEFARLVDTETCYACEMNTEDQVPVIKCQLCQYTYHAECFDKEKVDRSMCSFCEDIISEKLGKDVAMNKTKQLVKEFAVCFKVLIELWHHPQGGEFLAPIDVEALPLYKKVIKKPMDLSTVKTKLENLIYEDAKSFYHDVKLIFENCKKFNDPSSAIYKDGRKLFKFFETRWILLCDNK